MSTSTTEPSAGSRRLTSTEFRDVIGHFASGVTVITTALEERRFGTTASAVCSLSMEPPMVLICMNKTSTTGQAISDARAFAVNILSEEQGALAERFASKAADKFRDEEVGAGSTGQPLLNNALAHLECRVVEAVTGGTHTVFLAEVESATARGGSPLAYFRGQFGRLELTQDLAAYEALRARVLSGAIQAGEELDTRALAIEIGAPPGPLYHALGKLTSEGIVERRPNGRLAVRPITWPVVADALDARCAIELGVVERTVGHVSEELLAKFRAAMEAWVPVDEEGGTLGLDDSVSLSMDFHETMVSLAGSHALLLVYRHLAVPGILASAFQGYVISHDDDVFDREHHELLEAYETGDVARARAVVLHHTEHIKTAARRVLETDSGSTPILPEP